jgi:hypothetical protein
MPSIVSALFHNLKKAEDLKTWFGIDLFYGLSDTGVTLPRRQW